MSELEDLMARAAALPVRGRAELAEMLIQSLEEEDGEAIKMAWLAEIRRRDQEIGTDDAMTRPADEVLREVREQLRCPM